MIRAIWNGTVIAEAPSDAVRTVEGNVYFPADALHRQYLRPSQKTTTCGWKGVANYYDVVVEGQENAGAAWYYATPLEAAGDIAGYVAFWRGVEVRS